MADATEAAAKANPHQKFAIVDCSYASDCLSGAKETNIDQLVFNTVQDGFLGGYLAAGMSKSHIVATYGGEDFGTVTIYEDGFWDGVQYYNTQHHTNVKVLGWNEQTQKGDFIGNFTDAGMLNLRSLSKLQSLNLAGVDLTTRHLAELPNKPPRLDVIDVSPLLPLFPKRQVEP